MVRKGIEKKWYKKIGKSYYLKEECYKVYVREDEIKGLIK